MAPRPSHRLPKIPEMTIRRLSVYTRCLLQLEEDGIKTISSQELAERFNLTPEATAELMKASERAKAGSLELFGFVRTLMKAMDEDQRIEVIEMLWEVAYADGVLDAHEDAMIRKVAGLLYVSDFDRGAARRRVREKLGLRG